MKIKSEWDLIKKISERIDSTGLKLAGDEYINIGDDCFAFKNGDDRYGLISTDMSVEDVHFKRYWASGEDIGYKAMAGNISDISAMGGTPRFAFVSIGVPLETDEEYILSIYDGMIEAVNISGAVIAGGDTVSSEKIIISIAIYGDKASAPVSRSSAQSGDYVYVTGALGGSKAGLELLSSGLSQDDPKTKDLIMQHIRPNIRSGIVPHILNTYAPTSMIDVSDGLLSDLGHICEMSGKGFEIYPEKIPVSNDLKIFCDADKKNAVDYALDSGEEFELLFTSKKNPSASAGCATPVTAIGKIIDHGFFVIENNTKRPIDLQGFDHFKK